MPECLVASSRPVARLDKQQADQRWSGSEAVKRPNCCDKEARHSDIGGYKGRVRKNVGIKDHQSKSNETDRVAKPLPSRQKHEEAQSESKQFRARSHLEDKMLSISVITSQPVAAIQIRFRFEKPTGHWWRYPQAVRKNGNGREKLG